MSPRPHGLDGSLDLETNRHVLRLLLVRHDREIPGARGAEHADEAPALLAQDVGPRLLVPLQVRRHQPARPHQPEPGPEAADHGHGERALDVEQYREPRLLDRSEEDRAHREGRVRVDEHRGLGPYFHAREHVLAFDLDRVVLQPEGEREVVDELQRVDPRLERAALVAEERRAPAHDVEEAAAPRGRAQLEPARLDREARDEARSSAAAEQTVGNVTSRGAPRPSGGRVASRTRLGASFCPVNEATFYAGRQSLLYSTSRRRTRQQANASTRAAKATRPDTASQGGTGSATTVKRPEMPSTGSSTGKSGFR